MPTYSMLPSWFTQTSALTIHFRESTLAPFDKARLYTLQEPIQVATHRILPAWYTQLRSGTPSVLLSIPAGKLDDLLSLSITIQRLIIHNSSLTAQSWNEINSTPPYYTDLLTFCDHHPSQCYDHSNLKLSNQMPTV